LSLLVDKRHYNMKVEKIGKEKVIEFMEWFKKEFGHYPTGEEYANSPQRPCCVKTMQRNFGGLVKLRTEMGIENPDHRRGVMRSEIAERSQSQSVVSEHIFYRGLVEKYGKINIHRWEPYVDGIVIRSDYGIFVEGGNHYFVDVFWAGSLLSALGIINIKLKKIRDIEIKDKIYFVCTNEDLDIEKLYKRISTKKIKMPDNITVLGISDFRSKFLAKKN